MSAIGFILIVIAFVLLILSIWTFIYACLYCAKLNEFKEQIMSNVKLKPCHVCGATRGLYVLEDYYDSEWYVFCDSCKTSVHNERAETKEEAIECWNNRRENGRTTRIVRGEEEIAYFTNIVIPLRCEECGCDISMKFNYCPNCGGKIVNTFEGN